MSYVGNQRTYTIELLYDLYGHLSNTASHSSLLSPSTQGFGPKNCEDTYFYFKSFLNFHMYPTFSESLQSIYSPELKNSFEQAEIFKISEFDLVFKISAYQQNFYALTLNFVVRVWFVGANVLAFAEGLKFDVRTLFGKVL